MFLHVCIVNCCHTMKIVRKIYVTIRLLCLGKFELQNQYVSVWRETKQISIGSNVHQLELFIVVN
jgi:hypothetical protein